MYTGKDNPDFHSMCYIIDSSNFSDFIDQHNTMLVDMEQLHIVSNHNSH